MQSAGQPPTSTDCNKGPVAISFTVKDYHVISGWPDKTPASTERAAAILYQLYLTQTHAKALQAVIEDVSKSPEDFGNPDMLALKTKSKALDAILEDIDNKVSTVKKLPLEPPNFEPISFAGIEPLPIKKPRTFPLKVVVNTTIVGFTEGPADRFLGTAINGRFLEGFSVRFDPPVDGLIIKYSAKLRSVSGYEEKIVFGQDGELLKEPQWGPATLVGCTMWLEGPLAKFYNVYYRARVYGSGFAPISGRATNQEECNADKPRMIEALKVCVVAKDTPENASACTKTNQ